MLRSFPFLWIFALGVHVCLTAPARAEEKPLWEFGMGFAPMSMQDYRGANERHGYVLPLPYLVYRGEVLQVDRQKMRGLLYHSERVELDVSVNGSVPVKSDSNAARQGMPDLDPAIEIGPQLSVQLPADFTLKLPLRQVLAMDGLRPRGAGVIFSPNLGTSVNLGDDWSMGISGGPLYGSKAYHDYYYTVLPAYATAVRPVYAARAGYSGTQMLLTASRRYSTYWVGGFVRADYLRGAVFEDSPLVKRDYSLSAGFGVAWVFKESTTRVHVED